MLLLDGHFWLGTAIYACAYCPTVILFKQVETVLLINTYWAQELRKSLGEQASLSMDFGAHRVWVIFDVAFTFKVFNMTVVIWYVFLQI